MSASRSEQNKMQLQWKLAKPTQTASHTQTGGLPIRMASHAHAIDEPLPPIRPPCMTYSEAQGKQRDAKLPGKIPVSVHPLCDVDMIGIIQCIQR